MQYVGLYTQQRRNNTRSVMLLILFPLIVVFLIAGFSFLFATILYGDGYDASTRVMSNGMQIFLSIAPWAIGVVAIWFVIAYCFNTSMIRHATRARSLERRENPRVYNIVENLTMTCGMPMPQINVIDSPELNAFASGIDQKSYTVTVTTGICEALDDDELTGVIAHELTHIRNRDTRLLIVSIIFVGIMSTITAVTMRLLWHVFLWGGDSGSSRNSKNKNSGGGIIIVLILVAVVAAIGYLFTILTRFAISRKREYMADAGGAELCGNPLALASALRKISGNPYSAKDGREDVQQLFIIHPQKLNGGGIGSFFSNLFSTHPSTKSRIAFLEQL